MNNIELCLVVLSIGYGTIMNCWRILKRNPDCGFGVYLEWLFDFIFSPTAKTGYVMLDETIASTRKRKDRLLKVLIYPVVT